MATGTLYLRPSADLSVEHDLYPAGSTSAYSLINEEIADGRSTYIISKQDDYHTVISTSKFRLSNTSAIGSKPFFISAVNIVGDEFVSSTSMSASPKNRVALEINGVEMPLVSTNSSKNEGSFDCSFPDAIEAINEYLADNKVLPEINIIVESTTWDNTAPMAYIADIARSGVSQVYAVLTYEEILDTDVYHKVGNEWKGVISGYQKVNNNWTLLSIADCKNILTSNLLQKGVIGGKVPVTNISVTPTNIMIGTENYVTLEAKVLPDYATNKKITWSSSDSSIATVDPNSGLISVQRPGNVTIYATAQDGSGKQGTCLINAVEGTVLYKGTTFTLYNDYRWPSEYDDWEYGALLGYAWFTDGTKNYTSILYSEEARMFTAMDEDGGYHYLSRGENTFEVIEDIVLTQQDYECFAYHCDPNNRYDYCIEDTTHTIYLDNRAYLGEDLAIECPYINIILDGREYTSLTIESNLVTFYNGETDAISQWKRGFGNDGIAELEFSVQTKIPVTQEQYDAFNYYCNPDLIPDEPEYTIQPGTYTIYADRREEYYPDDYPGELELHGDFKIDGRSFDLLSPYGNSLYAYNTVTSADYWIEDYSGKNLSVEVDVESTIFVTEDEYYAFEYYCNPEYIPVAEIPFGDYEFYTDTRDDGTYGNFTIEHEDGKEWFTHFGKEYYKLSVDIDAGEVTLFNEVDDDAFSLDTGWLDIHVDRPLMVSPFLYDAFRFYTDPQYAPDDGSEDDEDPDSDWPGPAYEYYTIKDSISSADIDYFLSTYANAGGVDGPPYFIDDCTMEICYTNKDGWYATDGFSCGFGCYSDGAKYVEIAVDGDTFTLFADEGGEDDTLYSQTPGLCLYVELGTTFNDGIQAFLQYFFDYGYNYD